MDSAAQGDDMNETDIQYVLGRHLFLKKICIPNVNMYCVGKTEYEADFIYFDLKTRYLTEIEIKTSIQDFRNDFKKKRYHDCENVKYLYYAIPRSLYDAHCDEIKSLIGDAGLILIDEIDSLDFRGNIYEFGGFVKRAKARKDAYPLSPKAQMYYLRIGCMKWVNR